MQKYSKIFAWAVVAVMALAVAVTLICGGFNFSQTLSGGYLLKFDINQEFEIEDLSKIVAAQNVGDYQVLKAGEKQDQAIIRVQKIAPSAADQVQPLHFDRRSLLPGERHLSGPAGIDEKRFLNHIVLPQVDFGINRADFGAVQIPLCSI